MPNKLPQGWVECKLEDILSNEKYSIKRGPFGSSLKKTFFVPAGIRVFEQYNPINNDPYWSRYYITESKYKELEAFTAKAGDFLVSCSGTLGKILQLPVDVEMGIINQALLKITVNNNLIDSEFFINLFQSPKFQKNILDNTIGTAIQNIASVKELKKIKILLPPLNEQKRIVEKIESEFKKIDEGLEHLEQAKEQIKQYRQSVLKSAFEGKLTQQNPDDESAEILLQKINPKASINHNDKLPQGWVECQLGEVCEVITGSTPSTKNDNNYNSKDYPFFKPTDLNAGYFTNDSKDYVSEYAFNRARKLPKNSVLVTCIGATIGKTGIIRQAGICNQQINAILPNNYILPELLYWRCTSEHFQNLIKQTASATTLPILNKSNFEKLYIVFMPLNEQKQIVEEIEKRFAVADEVEKVVEQNIEKAKQLKQSILKKAFEGRLVSQDPNDEPASKLLEKIKQEKNKNGNKTEGNYI